jgi:hypothetical protein
LTDDTYETESHHTPESRDRDARMVGHEVKPDTSEVPERFWAKCDFGFDGIAGTWLDESDGPDMVECVRIDGYRALLAERDALRAAQSYTYIGKDGKPILARDLEDERDALEAENQRLREAAKPFDDAARDRAAEAPEWCVNDALAIWVKIGDLRNLRAALKGDSHD